MRDQPTRTLGPHGNSTEVSFPRRGFICKVHLSKIPQRTTVIKDLLESQEPGDYGSGGRRRRADTTRPINFGTHVWRKRIKARREEIIGHVASQAASSSSGHQTDPIPVSPMVSVPAVSDNSPVVTTVGGVQAKMRSRQTQQQPNNEETSDAVACQKVKAAERTIGTIIEPATKKTDYVKRNIVEFCCGESPKIGQSKYQ